MLIIYLQVSETIRYFTLKKYLLQNLTNKFVNRFKDLINTMTKMYINE